MAYYNTNETTKIDLVGTAADVGRYMANEAYVEEMLKYKIVVVAQRDDYEGMYRLMEAFAGGALVLSDPMVVPPKYLVDGEHYVVYQNPEDLIEKALHYLNCPGERLRIAYNGWKLAMSQYRSFHMIENIILRETDLRR